MIMRFRFAMPRWVSCRRFGHMKAVEVCRAQRYPECHGCIQHADDVRKFGGRLWHIVDSAYAPPLTGKSILSYLCASTPKRVRAPESKPEARQEISSTDVATDATLTRAFKRLTGDGHHAKSKRTTKHGSKRGRKRTR